MASRQDIAAGWAFVRLFLKDDMTGAMKKSLAQVGSSLRDAGQQVTGVGLKVLAAGSLFAAPFVAAIKAASDFEENFSKFSVVFGDRTEDVKKWGDEFAAQVQRAEGDVVKFLAANQDLFVPLGFDPTAAEALSKKVVALTIDLASFNNMADADVHRDLQAALTGSGEVMKKYGVIVSEAAVKQELLKQGIDPKKVTEQEKVQARLNIIMRGTTAAQGDAIRTSGGFANQMKGLGGSIKDLAVEVGQALLPAVTKIITGIKQYVALFRDFIKNNSAAVIAVASLAAGIVAAGAVLVGIGGLLTVVGFAASTLATIVGAIGAAFAFLISPIGLVTAAVLGGIAAWLKFSDSGKNVVDTLKAALGEFFQFAKEVFGGIGDALKSGDLQLAGEIAFLGLQLAALEGLAALQELFGDTMTGIVGRILQGDIAGAWSDTLAHLGLLWAAWSEMVVTTMTGMAESVVQAWQKVATFIADKILEIASTPGFNKIFEFVSGVDVRAEIERGKKLGVKDPLTDAKTVAGDQIGGQADAMIAKLDAINKAARTATDAAAKDANDATGAGIDALYDSLDQKRDAFNRKRQAAADAAAGKAGAAKGPGMDDEGGAGAAIGATAGATAKNLITTSAASAVAAGYMGSSSTPQQRMADDMKDLKKLTEDEVVAMKQLVQVGQQIMTGLVYGA